MQSTIQKLSSALFQKNGIDQVPKEELKAFIEQYPYAAIGHIFQAMRKDLETEQIDSTIQTASMYVHNPYWLYELLQNIHEDQLDEIIQYAEDLQDPNSLGVEISEKAHEQIKIAPLDMTVGADATELVFEPYHTIDYFASQGIKISKEELEMDHFGKQLKSFTEWLKGMKKIQQDAAIASQTEDEIDHPVSEDAAQSVESSQIDTEAMAEVWIKQGKFHKAILIYNKLSLQNPAKSHYFATKIENLKSL